MKNSIDRRLLDGTASVVMIAAGCMVLWMGWTGRLSVGRSAATVPESPRAGIEDIEARNLVASIDRSNAFMGSVAPLAILEFSDFECPFCLRFARETLPQLKRDYVATHKSSLSFLHYPLEAIHAKAFAASAASVCAGRQGRFWEFHDLLFSERQVLARDMRENARQLGLEATHFQQCLESGMAEDRIRSNQSEGNRLGVTSTPTFFIGRVQRDGSVKLLRQLRGAYPFATFKTALDELLVAAERNPY